jgi:ectoine hydroxylase-related dioxygenase (phytanoyl-CoA dioxygenase family)
MVIVHKIDILDDLVADEVRQKGWSVIRGFLYDEDVRYLIGYFKQTAHRAAVDSPFFTTHWSPDADYRRDVNRAVQTRLENHTQQSFRGYKCLLGYYLVKYPGPDGEVTPHRDWSLTDEEIASGLLIWMPLTEASETNGALRVVEGSHQDVPIRGTNVHPELPSDIVETLVEVSIGDAVVMDSRLMHSSGPNRTDAMRLSAGLILMPETARIMHYFRKEGENGIRKIAVGDDFLTRSHFDHRNPTGTEHLLRFMDMESIGSVFGKGDIKRQTFKDSVLQERFEKYGFIIVRNFLDRQTISSLWQVYEENADVVTDRAFFISQWSNKYEHKERINQAVQAALVPRAAQYLDDYSPVFAVFGVKHPAKDSGMYLHQDWSHVDETRFRTVNVWCPLLDLNPDNGPVHLLKGSHRLFDTWRGVDIPDSFNSPGEDVLRPFMTDIVLNAGDAVMWDHRIIHGSGVNRSDRTRVAAIVNMRPRESKFYLFYADSYEQVKEIEVFEPPHDFFTANDSANDPALVKQRAVFCHRFPYSPLSVSEEGLKGFLHREFPGEFDEFE